MHRTTTREVVRIAIPQLSLPHPLDLRMTFRLAWIGLIVVIGCQVFVAQSTAQSPTQAATHSAVGNEFFESRIRPVLVEHCYECHNSADNAEGDLALDHKKAMLDGGAGGALIAPGDANKSRLIAILKHEVDGLEMPENGPKLSRQIIADFQTWIDNGAPDPRDKPPSAEELSAATSWEAIRERRKQWWSFQAIKPHAPPATGHPVDAFINQKIQAANLTPSGPAKPAVLVRRLYFVLIGLPPTAEQATTWTRRITEASQNQRASIVGELIDTLIDSPQFGERWARHWMDWIRYAESHGSEGDPRINNAWMYRDYLIRALNNDVPYDQLVRENIAGDLLKAPRIDRKAGINESSLGPIHTRMVFHGFAPTDALDERVRFTDDQINAFSKAFLGITVSCARCHNHKFDPISQKDYYALFGIFTSCRPARTVIDAPGKLSVNRQELAKLKPKIRQAIASDWLNQMARVDDPIARFKPKGDQGKPPTTPIARLVFDFHKNPKSWKKRKGQPTAKASAAADSTQQWDLSQRADYAKWFPSGTGLNDRPSPAGEFAISAGNDQQDKALHGIYPSGVYSHLLSAKHPARITSGNFAIGEKNELWVQVIGDQQARVRYAVQNYPRNGTVFPVTNLPTQWRWQRYDLTYWSGEQAHVEVAAANDIPLLAKNEERSWFGIRRAIVQPVGSPSPENKHESVAVLLADDPPTSTDELSQLVRHKIKDAIEAWKSNSASDSQALFLDSCLREGILANGTDRLPTAKPLLIRYRDLEAAIPVPTRVPGLEETVASDWPLYVRGDHKSPSDLVPRRFLESIDPTPFQTSQSGRLELADKVLDMSNPLTRRVIVNRIWHHLFGRGLVTTPDNLGRMGAKPTHPELLDYLATRFSQDGWSIKKMIRLIATSETWQRSSASTATSKDPDNALLARANIRRLEAEAIRDSMLAVSGRLQSQLYGAPVDANSQRRSVYMRVIRNSLDPFLRAFDFPEPFSTTGRRDVTNVPAQSLTLMNDPISERLARQWVDQVFSQPDSSTESRIRQMFMTAFSRTVSADEVARAKQYLADVTTRGNVQRKSFDELKLRIDTNVRQRSAIVTPVRQQLLKAAAAEQGAPSAQRDLPQPIASWDFSTNTPGKDLIGQADCQLHSGAEFKNGGLLLGGKGYATTRPINKTIRAKTLEAWVQLSHLNQRGGGAMTIQTPGGRVFDSIVFGERNPKHWMAGSNNFARTKDFRDAAAEQETLAGSVHLAIVYREDGQIIGYRRGKPYGKPYRSSGPVEFKAGDAIVSFGVRHLPAGNGRMLAGRILKANLYDRALSAAEVAATSGDPVITISTQQLTAAMTAEQRKRVAKLELEIQQQKKQLQSMGNPPESGPRDAWIDLARAMFTFKEFIYIR